MPLSSSSSSSSPLSLRSFFRHWLGIVVVVGTLITTSHTVSAIAYDDEIVSLPLAPHPLPARQFSGYLNGTDGCDTKVNGPFCYIHYWFCLAEATNEESESASSSYVNDYPVIVWLNGGPGSSSILGLLQELGPLLFNATGTGFMSSNPYSWTKLPANLLILESPIGVGYSYCSAQETPGQLCRNTDKYTASTSRAALVDFFRHKFPEYRRNPFYITGESYAGVYIPTLAYEIIQYNQEHPPQQPQQDDDDGDDQTIHLVGIAVGDPCTDNTAQRDSMDAIWYSNKYGLMDDQIFDTLWNTCQIRIPLTHLRSGTIQIPSMSRRENGQADDRMRFYPSKQKTLQRIHEQIEAYSAKRERELFLLRHGSTTISTSSSSLMNDDCDLAWKKFLFSSSNGLSQSWTNLYINDYNLYGFVTNEEDNAMAAYMNRDDVREALHVTTTPNLQQWPYPDAGFDYTKEFDACNDDDDDSHKSNDARSMIDFYRMIVPSLASGTIVYNGDTDPCVSYEGTRTAVKRIGMNELDGGSYRPWFYNHTATTMEILQEKSITFGPNLIVHDAGIQFGGEVTSYEKNLSFVTVHGSGHMVPQFRPQAAFHMLSKLLSNEFLSPLLPSNLTLRNTTDTEFVRLLDAWTMQAKSVPYVA